MRLPSLQQFLLQRERFPAFSPLWKNGVYCPKREKQGLPRTCARYPILDILNPVEDVQRDVDAMQLSVVSDVSGSAETPPKPDHVSVIRSYGVSQHRLDAERKELGWPKFELYPPSPQSTLAPPSTKTDQQSARAHDLIDRVKSGDPEALNFALWALQEAKRPPNQSQERSQSSRAPPHDLASSKLSDSEIGTFDALDTPQDSVPSAVISSDIARISRLQTPLTSKNLALVPGCSEGNSLTPREGRGEEGDDVISVTSMDSTRTDLTSKSNDSE